MNIMTNISIVVFAIVVLTHGTFVAATGVMVGGLKEIKDVNQDEGAKEALDSAVSHINQISDDQYKVTKVLSAQVQVVSGLKYYFTVNMAKTNCTKGSVNDVCGIQKEPQKAQVSTFEIEVWSRPWLNSSQSTIVIIKKCNGEGHPSLS